MVIISASGMLSGGRILHHLKAFGGGPRNAVVLTGYQEAGTRGEALLNRARSLRIHSINVPIRAEVAAGVKRVVTTNSIPHPTNAVDVSESLARVIRRGADEINPQ